MWQEQEKSASKQTYPRGLRGYFVRCKPIVYLILSVSEVIPALIVVQRLEEVAVNPQLSAPQKILSKRTL